MARKYQVNQEGYVYGVLDGPYRVKITSFQRRSYILQYAEQTTRNGHSSSFSSIEMNKHFISIEQFNPDIHK